MLPSRITKELSFEDSIERISEGMNWVLDKVKGNQNYSLKLLLEQAII